ncbi:hypothetical protein AVEN_147884-1 [Araneus ventricosus]|uniref:Uncharacterized protein n=1 Tax=Araneus ventricosus TaxID=182803 RepID=A0A4Y2V2X4_ARAVE|nr:hypothetical protein AVEN_147884-1 [Araneus ventricosus]
MSVFGMGITVFAGRLHASENHKCGGLAYCQTLRESLRQSDSIKRRGHADRGPAPRQCKASHRSSDPSFIGLFWLGSFGPPYSPDLATSDFHFFSHLKHHLGGNHYNDDEDVKTSMTSWLSCRRQVSMKRVFKI